MAFEHYDKCTLLLPMDGANNGTTFTDWSHTPKTISRFGDAKTVTTKSKYYGSSGFFDGVGDVLSAPASSDFDLGSGDFTIAAWVNLSTSKTTGSNFSPIIVRDVTSSTRGWLVMQSGDHSGVFRGTIFQGAAAYSVNGPSLPTAGLWHHVCFTRHGNDLKLAVDGVFGDSLDVTGVNVNSNPTYNVYIGSLINSINTAPSSSFIQLHGHLQDLILIKGAALWTSNFTPPTRLIGEISGTVTDENNDPVERTIIAVPRGYPKRVFGTASDTDGEFTQRVPATDCSVIVQHQGAPIKNDLIQRVVPA